MSFCNCVECGTQLTNTPPDMYEVAEKLKELPIVAGRIFGKPYCIYCLEKSSPPGMYRGNDDPSPGFENSVREWEDALNFV